MRIKRNPESELSTTRGKQLEALYHEPIIAVDILSRSGEALVRRVTGKDGRELDEHAGTPVQDFDNHQTYLQMVGLIAYVRREYGTKVLIFMWELFPPLRRDPSFVLKLFKECQLIYILQDSSDNHSQMPSKNLQARSFGRKQLAESDSRIRFWTPRTTCNIENFASQDNLSSCCFLFNFDYNKKNFIATIARFSEKGFKNAVVILSVSKYYQPRTLSEMKHDLRHLSVIDELISKSHECVIDVGMLRLYRPRQVFFD
jgi:hypothetical protein